MRAEGLCLRTVQEQIAGGDDDPWDPAGVTVADSPFGDDRVIATIRFDNSRPVGVARVRLVNGRLWAEVDVPDEHVREAEGAGRFLACGGVATREANPRHLVTSVALFTVAFVERTLDSGQPPWEWRTESDNKAASGPVAPPPPPPAPPADAPSPPTTTSPLAGMPADEFEH